MWQNLYSTFLLLKTGWHCTNSWDCIKFLSNSSIEDRNNSKITISIDGRSVERKEINRSSPKYQRRKFSLPDDTAVNYFSVNAKLSTLKLVVMRNIPSGERKHLVSRILCVMVPLVCMELHWLLSWHRHSLWLNSCRCHPERARVIFSQWKCFCGCDECGRCDERTKDGSWWIDIPNAAWQITSCIWSTSCFIKFSLSHFFMTWVIWMKRTKHIWEIYWKLNWLALLLDDSEKLKVKLSMWRK